MFPQDNKKFRILKIKKSITLFENLQNFIIYYEMIIWIWLVDENVYFLATVSLIGKKFFFFFIGGNLLTPVG